MATIGGRQGYATLDIVDAQKVPLEKHTVSERASDTGTGDVGRDRIVLQLQRQQRRPRATPFPFAA